MKSYSLKLGILLPEYMNTYGDRGNIIVLKNRCLWRNIDIELVYINPETSIKYIQSCNFILGGGAQDRQQNLAILYLRKIQNILKNLFDQGYPGLFVCGSPQLLGHYYMDGDGNKIEGLSIFDMHTKHFGNNKPRCIGNIVCEISSFYKILSSNFRSTIVGFENHGGRTYLGENIKPFAKVLKGNGNNGEDKTEGAIYKNCIATYCHGPFLAKNQHIADFLISKALETKYNNKVELKDLDDKVELIAHDYIVKREFPNF